MFLNCETVGFLNSTKFSPVLELYDSFIFLRWIQWLLISGMDNSKSVNNIHRLCRTLTVKLKHL